MYSERSKERWKEQGIAVSIRSMLMYREVTTASYQQIGVEYQTVKSWGMKFSHSSCDFPAGTKGRGQSSLTEVEGGGTIGN